MHIADKMDQVAYRFGALHWIGGAVFQDGALLFDRAGHTSLRTAVSVQIPLVFPPRNIDVMPGPVLALIAHSIRPGRSIHQQVRRRIATPASQLRIDGVFTKKLLDQLARFSCQVLLRNPGHRLVTLATPGLGRGRAPGEKRESARKKYDSIIHRFWPDRGSPVCSIGAHRRSANLGALLTAG